MLNWRTLFMGQDEYIEQHQQPQELDCWPAQPPLVARRPRQSLPPVMTPQDLQAAEEAYELINAIHVVAIATQEIANLTPRDTRTYGIMLGFRDAYAEGKKEAIYDMARNGHRRGYRRYY